MALSLEVLDPFDTGNCNLTEILIVIRRIVVSKGSVI